MGAAPPLEFEGFGPGADDTLEPFGITLPRWSR